MVFPTQLKTSAVKVSGLGVSPRSRQKYQFLYCQLQLTRMHCTGLNCTDTRSVVVSITALSSTFPYKKLSSLDITNAIAMYLSLSLSSCSCYTRQIQIHIRNESGKCKNISKWQHLHSQECNKHDRLLTYGVLCCWDTLSSSLTCPQAANRHMR